MNLLISRVGNTQISTAPPLFKVSLPRCMCILSHSCFLFLSPDLVARALAHSRCLIVTRFGRKVTPSAGANQPMNSGLTTELLTARVRAWKRVMNRLIPFHSQPGIPPALARLPAAVPVGAIPCHPSFLTARRIVAMQSLKIGCRKQPRTLLAASKMVIVNRAHRSFLP